MTLSYSKYDLIMMSYSSLLLVGVLTVPSIVNRIAA